MKKDTGIQSVASLYDEYFKSVSEQKVQLDEIDKDISQCDKGIARIETELEKNIHTLTSDQYVEKTKEIEKLRLSKEMNEKKIIALRGKLKGFDSEEEKKAFTARLRTSFKAEEDAFIAECDKHLQALEILLNDRISEANKGVSVAQSIGEYSIIAPSPVRQIVTVAINSRKALDHKR